MEPQKNDARRAVGQPKLNRLACRSPHSSHHDLHWKADRSSKSAVAAARRGQEERRKQALGRLRRGEASAAAMARAESDARRVAQLVRHQSERGAKEEIRCEEDIMKHREDEDATQHEALSKPRSEAKGNVRIDIAVEHSGVSTDGNSNMGDKNSDYSEEDDNDPIPGGPVGDIDSFLKKPSYSSAPGTLQRLSNAIEGPGLGQSFSAGIRRVSAFFSHNDAADVADAATTTQAHHFKKRRLHVEVQRAIGIFGLHDSDSGADAGPFVEITHVGCQSVKRTLPCAPAGGNPLWDALRHRGHVVFTVNDSQDDTPTSLRFKVILRRQILGDLELGSSISELDVARPGATRLKRPSDGDIKFASDNDIGAEINDTEDGGITSILPLDTGGALQCVIWWEGGGRAATIGAPQSPPAKNPKVEAPSDEKSDDDLTVGGFSVGTLSFEPICALELPPRLLGARVSAAASAITEALSSMSQSTSGRLLAVSIRLLGSEIEPPLWSTTVRVSPAHAGDEVEWPSTNNGGQDEMLHFSLVGRTAPPYAALLEVRDVSEDGSHSDEPDTLVGAAVMHLPRRPEQLGGSDNVWRLALSRGGQIHCRVRHSTKTIEGASAATVDRKLTEAPSIMRRLTVAAADLFEHSSANNATGVEPAPQKSRRHTIVSRAARSYSGGERSGEVDDGPKWASGELRLTVRSAKGLRSTQIFGHMDPYVKAYLMPSKLTKMTKPTINGDTTPQWTEEHRNVMSFTLSSFDQLGGPTLAVLVEIWNANTFSDDLIGSALLTLPVDESSGLSVGNMLWHPVSNGGFIECQIEHVRAKCVPMSPSFADEEEEPPLPSLSSLLCSLELGAYEEGVNTHLSDDTEDLIDAYLHDGEQLHTDLIEHVGLNVKDVERLLTELHVLGASDNFAKRISMPRKSMAT